MALSFHEHRLGNGLRIAAECNDAAHTAAVGFFVRGGSRDEVPQLMGVSHFLEHMMFKGTAQRTAEDVNREFDELGANYNAYTTQEMTAYFAQVLPEFLPRAVDLLSDMLRPALRTEDFDMERNVILEEIGMYEDRPQWRLQDTIIEQHFGSHPLSHRVLGTRETIEGMTADRMRAYFETCYGPDNITVTAAGQVDFDALVADITRGCGDWPSTGHARQFETVACTDQEMTLTDKKLTRHYLAVMYPGPDAQDDRRYAAGVFADVLGDDDGSRLYWALVDPGLADDVEFVHFPHDRTGSFFAFASCDPKRAAQVESMLLETIDACAAQVEPEEVERAKHKIATSVTLAGENPASRMRALGSQWIYLDRHVPLDEELACITAVDTGDITALVKSMPLSPRTLVRLGPTS